MRKRFDFLEKFILLMFSSVLCQQFFYMLSSPYERLRVVEEHLPFWMARLQYGINFPVLLMWVLYFLRGRYKLAAKIGICFSWVIGGVVLEKIMLILGVLTSKSKYWYPQIDIVLAMIVLISAVYFMEILTPILKIEKMIDHE
ncbi:hypothetical protein [Neobacillus sp. LXY-4]|uniref:hypothetical protein n=1 Tax=Neobacillus sp. LXY-4 TaxID=3379826 RepID=UPI003EE2EB14